LAIGAPSYLFNKAGNPVDAKEQSVLYSVASARLVRSYDFNAYIVLFHPTNGLLALADQRRVEKAIGARRYNGNNVVLRQIDPQSAEGPQRSQQTTNDDDEWYRLNDFVFSPDGKLVAMTRQVNTLLEGGATTSVREVIIQQWPGGQTLRTFKELDHATGLAFHPNGRTLAYGCADRTVKLRDLATGDILSALEGHESPVSAVAFTRDGATLASCDETGIVKLWATPTTGEIRTKRTLRLKPIFDSEAFRTLYPSFLIQRCLDFSSDGKLLAVGLGGGINIFDVQSGILLKTVGDYSDIAGGWRPYCVRFSPDDKRIAGAGYGDVKMWHVVRD
jgi:WD40 repeat protein